MLKIRHYVVYSGVPLNCYPIILEDETSGLGLLSPHLETKCEKDDRLIVPTGGIRFQFSDRTTTKILTRSTRLVF